MIFFYLIYLSKCSSISNQLVSGTFQLSFNISESRVDWMYSNCKSIKTSLHFADYSSTLQILFDQNLSLALKYTDLLFDSQVLCQQRQSFSFNYKGNLVFVIKSVTLLESHYEVIQFSTTFQYFCEFDREDLLEIQENNKSLKFLGKYSKFEVFRHGDLESSELSDGDLGYFLCGRTVNTLDLNEKCRSPAGVVGKMIRADGKSCILQGPYIQKHFLEYGKCTFNKNEFSGFLLFEDSPGLVTVQGLLELDVKVFLLSIHNTSYEVNCHNSKKICYFTLKIPKSSLLGSKVQIFHKEKSFTCIIGDLKKSRTSATTSNNYGHYYILFLFSITFLTILSLELSFHKSHSVISPAE